MRRDGIATRERILDAAQNLILDRGYVGMTVEHVLDEVGITKGAFFHHFKSKDDLARALLQRFAEKDAQIYSETRERAEKLSDDPLQQMLIFIGLFQEMFDKLAEPYPGCLFASYLYELQQFDDSMRALIRDAFVKWCDRAQVPAPPCRQFSQPRGCVHSSARRRLHHRQGA